jgi:hypothetical protein
LNVADLDALAAVRALQAQAEGSDGLFDLLDHTQGLTFGRFLELTEQGGGLAKVRPRRPTAEHNLFLAAINRDLSEPPLLGIHEVEDLFGCEHAQHPVVFVKAWARIARFASVNPASPEE